jgi:hypothetical protein
VEQKTEKKKRKSGEPKFTKKIVSSLSGRREKNQQQLVSE